MNRTVASDVSPSIICLKSKKLAPTDVGGYGSWTECTPNISWGAGISTNPNLVAQVFNLPFRRFSNRQIVQRTIAPRIWTRLFPSRVLPTGKSALRANTGYSAAELKWD